MAQHAHMLSDLKQLNSVTQTVVNCIDVVFKVGSLFYLQRE